MNIYIDLGAHKGNVLKRVVSIFTDTDLFVAFEPVPLFYRKIVKKFKDNPKVEVLNCAASCFDEDEMKFYMCLREDGGIGQGSTLIKGMYDSVEIVRAVNFSKYLEQNFKISDNIVVKIDIEGYEYDLLEHLIETNNIKYINKIYCEWHPIKLKRNMGSKKKAIKRQKNLLLQLQELGFDLKGDNNFDELGKFGKRKLKKERFYDKS